MWGYLARRGYSCGCRGIRNNQLAIDRLTGRPHRSHEPIRNTTLLNLPALARTPASARGIAKVYTKRA